MMTLGAALKASGLVDWRLIYFTIDFTNFLGRAKLAVLCDDGVLLSMNFYWFAEVTVFAERMKRIED